MMLRDLRAWLWKRRGVETLWGDGSHDDTGAVQAIIDGQPPVRRPDGKRAFSLPEGVTMRLTEPVDLRRNTGKR